jgi:hypothetical protein
LVSDSPLFRTQVVMIHLVSFRKKRIGWGGTISFYLFRPLIFACWGMFWRFQDLMLVASFIFSKITLGCWRNFGDP